MGTGDLAGLFVGLEIGFDEGTFGIGKGGWRQRHGDGQAIEVWGTPVVNDPWIVPWVRYVPEMAELQAEVLIVRAE